MFEFVDLFLLPSGWHRHWWWRLPFQISGGTLNGKWLFFARFAHTHAGINYVQPQEKFQISFAEFFWWSTFSSEHVSIVTFIKSCMLRMRMIKTSYWSTAAFGSKVHMYVCTVYSEGWMNKKHFLSHMMAKRAKILKGEIFSDAFNNNDH